MDKRTFLKYSSAMIAGATITSLTECQPEKSNDALRNWAGNLTYGTTDVSEPETLEEVVAIIKRSKKLRALGTRHCFNGIADSDSTLLSTRKLNKIITLDEANRMVTVEGGIRYGELCKYLDERGFALHNLASLPHISVAGSCATATHGSGVANGNLATAVTAIELVTGQGEVLSLSRSKNPDIFDGVVVNLGAIGVVTKVTLDIHPAFTMRQNVYFDLPMTQLENNFDAIMSAGYSVSLFTDWQGENVNQVWIKRKTDEVNANSDQDFYGARASSKKVHPIIELSPVHCTEQLGVEGPWFERLPHFKLEFTPSSGEELQAEYFVARTNAVDAIKAVQSLRNEIKPVLMISEIRTINGDSLWLSPCYQQDSIAIHFTLKQDVQGVNSLLPKIEAALSPYAVKPHWGKLFAIAPSILHDRYKKLADFKKLINQYDPEGKFQNAFTNKNILGDITAG